jgi:hypothetical protein
LRGGGVKRQMMELRGRRSGGEGGVVKKLRGKYLRDRRSVVT